MKGNSILVATAMRQDLLQRLHEGHQGQASMLQRARRAIYWPKIQDSISNLTERFPACQMHAKKKPKVPERQISATRSFEIIGADLMELHGQHILVSVDCFSGYILFNPVRSETAQEVIRTLNNSFRKFWPAERIAMDNGSCFKSTRFKDFCDKLHIRHTTSNPHYHQSNGVSKEQSRLSSK